MSFQNTIEAVGLHQIITLLNESNRSGILTVQSKLGQSKIIFRFGEMIHGSSTRQEENLFDFIVSQGLLTAEHEERLRAGEKLQLATIIRELSSARKLEIVAALQARAKLVLFDTLFWEEGDYEFVERDITDADYDRIEKEVTELEQLSDNDLDRLVRLKQLLPFKTITARVNLDQIDIIQFSLTEKEQKLLKELDDKRTLDLILPELEGKEMYNLFSILNFLEARVVHLVVPVQPSAVWQAKLTDFIKVYEGALKKSVAFYHRAFGTQGRFYLKHAFQQANKENYWIWRNVTFTPEGTLSSDVLSENVQSLPVHQQIRLFKNSMNTLLIWQLIFLKMYGGKSCLNDATAELNAILSVLQKKGNINHQEIAQEIPKLFAIASEYPSFIDQGKLLVQLKRFDDATVLFNKIPSSHPERETVDGFLAEVKKKRELASGVQDMLNRIYSSLIGGDLLTAKKLLGILKEDSPDHPDILSIENEFRQRSRQIFDNFTELDIVPTMNENTDPSQFSSLNLTAEEGFLLSRVDGYTDLKGILAISYETKEETLLALNKLESMGLINLPRKEREEPAPSKSETTGEQKQPAEVITPKQQVTAERKTDDVIELHAPTSRPASKGSIPTQKKITATSPRKSPRKKPGATVMKKKKPPIPRELTPSQQRKKQADVFFTKGLSAMKKNNFKEAITAFEKAIETFPASVAYYQYLDQARLQFKEHAAANLIEITRKAMKSGQMKAAVHSLKQALSLAPRNTKLLLLSVDIWLAIKRQDLAIRSIASLIEMEPGNPDYYVSLGNIYAHKGDLVKARNHYKMALQWNKNHGEAKKQLKLLP